MLISAVSVFVVAQSSSEIPEGIMNNPVYYNVHIINLRMKTGFKSLLICRLEIHPSISQVKEQTSWEV